jgi:hypothetical protein
LFDFITISFFLSFSWMVWLDYGREGKYRESSNLNWYSLNIARIFLMSDCMKAESPSTIGAVVSLLLLFCLISSLLVLVRNLRRDCR